MPNIKVKRFKQKSAHRQTDGHTDATKRIIAPATRSIINKFSTAITESNKQHNVELSFSAETSHEVFAWLVDKRHSLAIILHVKQSVDASNGRTIEKKPHSHTTNMSNIASIFLYSFWQQIGRIFVKFAVDSTCSCYRTFYVVNCVQRFAVRQLFNSQWSID